MPGHRDPAPARGERPTDFVPLNEGAAASAEEIIAFRRECLAHYKCPDSIEFGPLPKTSTGKTQKFVLRPARMGRPGHAGRRRVTFLNRPTLTRADHHRRTGRLGYLMRVKALTHRYR
jgi:hypothetical protein